MAQSDTGLGCGFVFLVVLAGAWAWFTWDTADLLLHARRATGEVTRVGAYESRCGSGQHAHDCTRSEAVVRYEYRGLPHHLQVGAGSAGWSVGDEVTVIYDGRDPDRSGDLLRLSVRLGCVLFPVLFFLVPIVTGLRAGSEGRPRSAARTEAADP